MENITDNFKNFINIRNTYISLIEIIKSKKYNTLEIFKNKDYLKRIQINNCIVSILEALERFKISNLTDKDKEEFQNLFNQNNIDLTTFRNCLAHAHYEISEDNSRILFKKDNFNMELSTVEFEKISTQIFNYINDKLKIDSLEFDGINLNSFINDLIDNKDLISITPQTYATLLESFNIYHAFLYEKLIQLHEKNQFTKHYENRIILNSNLPYLNSINHITSYNKSNKLDFKSLDFNELSINSREELIYLLLTSEYRYETLELLNKMLDTNINETTSISDIIDYIDNNENTNIGIELVNFMISRLPQIGRIYRDHISPKKDDLLHGFYKDSQKDEKTFNLNLNDTFIYPSTHTLIRYASPEIFLDEYAESNRLHKLIKSLEITESKIIKIPDMMMYLLENYNFDQDDTDLKEILNKMNKIITDTTKNNSNETIIPGKIYNSVIKGEESRWKVFFKDYMINIPIEHKIGFLKEKIEAFITENNYKEAYKYLLLLIKIDHSNSDYFIIKDRLEHEFSSNNEYMNDETVKKMIQVGGVYELYTKLNQYKCNSDYTDFLAHIRNSSIHSSVEVEYPEDMSKDTEFTVNKSTMPDLLCFTRKIHSSTLDDIRFNFQDYDRKHLQTSFLLMNIPASTFVEILNIQSEGLLENLKFKNLSEKNKDEQDDYIIE